MDAYNVISISYDINALDREMENWSNLPYEIRMHSNDECIRRYGCTNIDLYNRVKSYLLKIKPLDTELDIDTLLSESNNDVPDFYKVEDLQEKIKYTDELNQAICIALINPSINNIEDLNVAYLKFMNLSEEDKLLSNSYSLAIWGYNVYNMYILMKNDLEMRQNAEDNSAQNRYEYLPWRKKTTIFYTHENSFLQDITSMKIVNNDKLGLLKYKLRMCDPNIPSSEYISLASLSESVNKRYDDRVDALRYAVANMVPYYNNDEKSFISYNKDTEVTNENYSYLVNKSINEYKAANDDESKAKASEVLENLGVPSTLVDMGLSINKIAEINKQRQMDYLKEFAPRIIDISDIKVNEVDLIRESTHEMRNIFKSKNLYPVYIVLSYTDTLFGHVIRKIKKSTYTHAAICLDSNLKEMITFKFDHATGENGIVVEDLDYYLKKSDESLICVLCVFVDRSTRANIHNALNNFVANKEKTKYGIGNLFNILINRSIKDDPNRLTMVCSQFVDSILKLAKININTKTSNLVIPQDFEKIKHPKLFKVYEGLAKNYTEKEVESKIKMLLKESGRKNMIYTDLIDKMNESVNLLEFFKSAYVTDNEKANSILEEARELLTPVAVIYEREFPIKLKDDGTISIALYKSLEDRYQEAHKIILATKDDNLPTLKYQMARLFALGTYLDKKLSKMDRSNANYKKCTDLKARVYNDYYKVSDIVYTKDKNFNFETYYKNTEYYNGSLDIDPKLFRFTGNKIKDIIINRHISKMKNIQGLT